MAKVYGAAMVRNEADIIEAFVRHNLTVLDGLAVVDHGSFDGTSEILAALVAEGLPVAVVRDDSTGHHQGDVMTRLVRDVLARTPADFVCALDADEFLKVRSRPLLDRVLQQLPPGMHAVVEWHTYVPDFAAANPEGDVRKCIAGARRLAQERHDLYKVVVARDFLRTGDALIGSGNHLVVPSPAAIGAGQSNPHAKLAPEVLALAHLPVRSCDQFTAKIAIGWLATLATHAAPANAAFHWREVVRRHRCRTGAHAGKACGHCGELRRAQEPVARRRPDCPRRGSLPGRYRAALHATRAPRSAGPRARLCREARRRKLTAGETKPALAPRRVGAARSRVRTSAAP